MGKYDTVIKNISILTIGQFSSKILVFILVPIYTSVLSTDEYGIYDLVLTTINLMIPIFTLNISVSSQRFLLDINNDYYSIIWTSIKYTIIGFISALFFLVINAIIGISIIIKNNQFQFILLFVVLASNAVLTEIAIGLEKLNYVAISGIISTLVTIGLNILFLIVIRLGLKGYFLANIAGPFSQTIFLLWGLKIKARLNVRQEFSVDIEKKMLEFSKPQIFNTISWWINNASDRYIVTWFCGIDVNGIYSVAYKIPAIINMLGGIFSQATTIFIIKNFDSEDKEGYFSDIYRIYNAFLIICCSCIILFTRLIAKLMFAKGFYVGWKFVPMLVIASMFGAIAGYLGGVFSAKLAARRFSESTMVGALTNVILNLFLVQIMGAMGAAIATCISYFVIWVLRFYHARKYIKMNVNILQSIVSYFLLIIQGLILIYSFFPGKILYIVQICIFIVLLIMYKDEILMSISALYKHLKS